MAQAQPDDAVDEPILIPQWPSSVSKDDLDIDSDGQENDDVNVHQRGVTQRQADEGDNDEESSHSMSASISNWNACAATGTDWMDSSLGKEREKKSLERLQKWKQQTKTKSNAANRHGAAKMTMNKYYLDTKKAYQDAVDDGEVTLTVSSLDALHATPLKHQGNEEFYSEENINKRFEIRNNPVLIKELEMLWEKIPKVQRRRKKSVVVAAEQQVTFTPSSKVTDVDNNPLVFEDNDGFPPPERLRRATMTPACAEAAMSESGLLGSNSIENSTHPITSGVGEAATMGSSSALIEVMPFSEDECEDEYETVEEVNYNMFRAFSAHIFHKLVPAGTMAEFADLVKDDFLRACSQASNQKPDSSQTIFTQSMMNASMSASMSASLSTAPTGASSSKTPAGHLNFKKQQEDLDETSALTINKMTFLKVLLDIVDVWTKQVAVGEYVKFTQDVMQRCVKKLAGVDPEVPYDLRNAFNKDFAKRRRAMQRQTNKMRLGRGSASSNNVNSQDSQDSATIGNTTRPQSAKSRSSTSSVLSPHQSLKPFKVGIASSSMPPRPRSGGKKNATTSNSPHSKESTSDHVDEGQVLAKGETEAFNEEGDSELIAAGDPQLHPLTSTVTGSSNTPAGGCSSKFSSIRSLQPSYYNDDDGNTNGYLGPSESPNTALIATETKVSIAEKCHSLPMHTRPVFKGMTVNPSSTFLGGLRAQPHNQHHELALQQRQQPSQLCRHSLHRHPSSFLRLGEAGRSDFTSSSGSSTTIKGHVVVCSKRSW